jgi:hypothetical protein
MPFKPTIFEVEVNNETFRFAAMTMKEMEDLAETEAKADGDQTILKRLNIEVLANAMIKAGMQTSAAEIAESMPVPVYRSLLSAFLVAQGVKLEAKAKSGGIQLS